MTTKKQHKAPGHLRADTAAWFSAVMSEYELEPHHVRLLTMAAEAFDRATEAREAVEAAGAYYTDRFGCPKAHPGIAVERDCRVSFARLLRELDLDVDPPSESRPPMLARYGVR